MRYNKTRGVTVPFRTRMSIEEYERLQDISEASGISLCALTERMLQYALRHAKFREVVHKEIYFDEEDGVR